MYYEGLQDKLAQVRDARAALNALRDEHREKLRRAAEEAERQRQIQLAQKLEIMRQKKQVGKRHEARRSLKVGRRLTLVFPFQEYLEMQRQLAIQRLQEQEKERQMRLEQQKHTIQMRAQMPAFSLPYAQVAASPPCASAAAKAPFTLRSPPCVDAVSAAKRGRRGGVPAWCPAQLPRHLQPCWLRRGFTYAQHLHEPRRPDGTVTVPGHARCCHR